MTIENVISITLIGANLVAVLTGFFAIAKLVWYLSKLDSKATDAKAAAVRAHKRIDDIEKYNSKGRA